MAQHLTIGRGVHQGAAGQIGVAAARVHAPPGQLQRGFRLVGGSLERDTADSLTEFSKTQLSDLPKESDQPLPKVVVTSDSLNGRAGQRLTAPATCGSAITTRTRSSSSPKRSWQNRGR